MRYLLCLTLLLSSCSITSQDADTVGMVCEEGHQEVVTDATDNPVAIFICDRYVRETDNE